MNILDLSAHSLRIGNEITQQLVCNSSIRIEQIISTDCASPTDFWYDQTENEWLTILQGYGIIEYTDNSWIKLNIGDTLVIPAHTKHRVKKTANPTIWLAVFYK